MFSRKRTVTRFRLSCILVVGMLLYSADLSAQALYESAPTEANEVNFMVSNNGILGLDLANSSAGGYWPRSAASPGAYLFGSGVWFGALVDQGDPAPQKRVVVTYNPNSGLSWAVPGDIADGPELQSDPASVQKNKLFRSTDYTADGQSIADGQVAWPLWNLAGIEIGPQSGNLGAYVNDVNTRTVAEQQAVPVFISDEDIICRYKTTDVSRYEGNPAFARKLDLQYEQAVYSWSAPARENFILVRYDVTNVGEELMQDCSFGHAGDFDIGDPQSGRTEAANDRLESFVELADRPMVAMWSDGGVDVNSRDYGYFGVAMLQTPAVDQNGFLRTDVDPADFQSQLGLTTVRNWVIQNDPTSHEERYDFMTANTIDGTTGSGSDRRLLFSSGTFNLRPGETARFVMAFVFAPSVGPAPDGSEADVANLVEEVNNATQTWTNLVVSVSDRSARAPFSVQLSPNPVNNLLTIRAEAVPGGLPGIPLRVTDAQLNIIDQAGRVLFSKNVKLDPAAGLQKAIDVSSLSAGNYFCRLQVGEFTQSQVFVLVR